MKKDSTNKIRLGMFVFIGFVFLCIGIYFIGAKQQLFRKTFHLNAEFNDVSGLQVGNNVRFSGINVGTIQSISIISDTSVKVTMVIDSEVKQFIKKDALAVIGSDGLMGNKIMNITPGSPDLREVEDNELLASIQPISMDAIVQNLKTTTDNVTLITSDLAALLNNIRAGKGTIGKLLMDSVFAENLDQTIVNVKQGSKGFKQNMDAAGNSFLLKGYFKKKEKERKKQEEKAREAAEEQKKKAKEQKEK